MPGAPRTLSPSGRAGQFEMGGLVSFLDLCQRPSATLPSATTGAEPTRLATSVLQRMASLGTSGPAGHSRCRLAARYSPARDGVRSVVPHRAHCAPQDLLPAPALQSILAARREPPNAAWHNDIQAVARKHASRGLQACVVDLADYTSRDRACQQATYRDARRPQYPWWRLRRTIARSVSRLGWISLQSD